MPRYIDADALKDVIQQHDYPLSDKLNSIGNGMFTLGIFQAIDQMPTVSPDEVRGVGKWIIRKTAFGKEYTVCSACLTEIKIRKTSGEIVHADTRNARYCMACGAKMEVSEDA